MNTKKVENNDTVSNGLNMVLECDKLAKEERTKCLGKDRRENLKAEGNEVLKTVEKI